MLNLLNHVHVPTDHLHRYEHSPLILYMSNLSHRHPPTLPITGTSLLAKFISDLRFNKLLAFQYSQFTSVASVEAAYQVATTLKSFLWSIANKNIISILYISHAQDTIQITAKRNQL